MKWYLRLVLSALFIAPLAGAVDIDNLNPDTTVPQNTFWVGGIKDASETCTTETVSSQGAALCGANTSMNPYLVWANCSTPTGGQSFSVKVTCSASGEDTVSSLSAQ